MIVGVTAHVAVGEGVAVGLDDCVGVHVVVAEMDGVG